jgi:chromosome partitioning protein
MLTISAISLAGGQGKTTTTLLTAKNLAQRGFKVLAIDADPQASLTFLLGHTVAKTDPTLLEVLSGEIAVKDAFYTTDHGNLFLIPADNHLNKAQEVLSNTGGSAFFLRQKLRQLSNLFDFCLIDSPPQRIQLTLAVGGATDRLIIPVEATTKGVKSLVSTLTMIEDLQSLGAFTGVIVGIVPFRDRYFGLSQSIDSRDAIAAIKLITDIPVLPSIVESERYKQALRTGTTLESLGFPDLEHPLTTIEEKILCLQTA